MTATVTASSPAQSAVGAVVGVGLCSFDAPRLVRFYEAVLGLRFERHTNDAGRIHYVTRQGAVHMEIKALANEAGELTPDATEARLTGAEPATNAGNVEVSFRVDDVAETVAEALTHGAGTCRALTDYSWGRFAVVLDPDRNRLGFWQPASLDAEGGA